MQHPDQPGGHIDWRDWVGGDKRPQRGMWAPGRYNCKCLTCEQIFIGDKRALTCADCAYRDS